MALAAQPWLAGKTIDNSAATRTTRDRICSISNHSIRASAFYHKPA
jgi:hypothetical protein